MLKYLTSKIAIVIYVLIVFGAVFFAYRAYEKQSSAPAAPSSIGSQPQAQSNPTTVAQTESTDPALGGSPSAASTGTTTAPTNNSSPTTTSSTTTSTDDGSSSSSSPADDTNAPPVSTDKNVSGSMLANITTDDCNNNCQPFASNLSQLEYCQEVCGISPVKDITSSSTCKKDSGIQEDYCYKDLAITKEDSSYCDDISDANVKQTCQSRIQQDAIENQMKQNSGSDN